VSEELLQRATAWRDADPDPDTRAEIEALIERISHPDEVGSGAALADLTDRFAGSLQFGTAGLRGRKLRMPVAHAEGNYFADPDTLGMLEAEGRVVLRYVGGAPNGAARDIAGVAGGPRMNVVGLMPHPERPAQDELRRTDGLRLFEALLGA